jgi:phage shock protein A
MTLKPFPKGVSGNPGGRTKKPLVDRMLEEALAADDSKKAKQIADRLISLAATKGSIAAAKLIVERVEGKPKRNADESEQRVQLTKEQVDQQLAELLKDPDLRNRLAKLMTPDGKTIQ